MISRHKILAHRGYWRTPSEKNSLTAFQRAFELGFGVETDLRDYAGRLLISHDPPVDKGLSVDNFFQLYKQCNTPSELALNIKADGLAPLLDNLLKLHDIELYFCFDMSVPDTLTYRDYGLNFYARHSEYEQSVPFDDCRLGVWYDAFGDNEVNLRRALKSIESGEHCCLVSPELHGRSHKDIWNNWKSALGRLTSDQLNRISICTDFPEDLEAFFLENDQ